MIFADVATTGDGILTGAMLLDVVHGTGHAAVARWPASWSAFPRCSATSRSPIASALDGEGKFWAVARDAQNELGDDGRVLVRPSGTEPLVRVMVEAPTEQQAESIADRLVAAVTDACGAVTETDAADR